MKSWIDKFSANTARYEWLILLVPFSLWLWCFHYFFTGQLVIEADAISYANHITFYTDNLSKGIYPLWNPSWYQGAPNDFFLRRIGDVNPLLFFIIALKWIGVGSVTAYLLFLALYYFLAGLGLYLITRFLLVDRFFAFTVYILFLFSSWGAEVFYNYIIIIFVPIVWFFYFLLCFSRTPQKSPFLGMIFCTGLILTTYIPFFFLTILGIFTFFYIVFYGRDFTAFLKSSFSFFATKKLFAVFCLFFVLVSCIPALMFYKESKTGEFVLPNRHAGSDVSSAVAVGLDNVTSGDIISHGYFDRIFDDQANIDMGDIYIPYIFFLLLLTTAVGRVNKLIFFLLFNILGLSLITITSASGVHHFLYSHLLIFKFIRNIYYFFWLAMLPMAILLCAATFKSLLTTIDASSQKTSWLVYIIICHVAFLLFLCTRQGVLWMAWVAVFISMLYFWIYFRFNAKISYPAGFILFLLAVFIQTAQVNVYLDKKLFQSQIEGAKYLPEHQELKLARLDIYYAAQWFAVLVSYLDPQVLEQYRNHQFIFYDNVLPYADSSSFVSNEFQRSIASNANLAFVSKFGSKPDDWNNNPGAPSQADMGPQLSGELTVYPSDSNTWKFATHLKKAKFLVINDNYDSDWHAFINGHPARLLRANIAFKGLWVPAGESKVVLRFSNPKRYMFHFALIAIFAGIFLYLLVLFRKERLCFNG